MNGRTVYPFPGGRNKAVILSYDDGTIHDRRMVSILNAHGIRGTFHLNSGKLGTEGYLRPDDVRTLYDGHEIAAHTATHPNLCEFDEGMIVREVREDTETLSKLAGYQVRGFSYPFGAYNDYVSGILAKTGIVYARTVHSTFRFGLPQDFMKWHPTCHHGDNLADIARSFITLEVGEDSCAILFVWGHSYEFHDHNNWHVMEEFCAQISGQASIWSATGIGIYDHMNG